MKHINTFKLFESSVFNDDYVKNIGGESWDRLKNKNINLYEEETGRFFKYSTNVIKFIHKK
jgi:hypothetical protein